MAVKSSRLEKLGKCLHICVTASHLKMSLIVPAPPAPYQVGPRKLRMEFPGLLPPCPPIYRQLLLFLFAPPMCLLTVSSPSSLQGVHEREGAEGGPAAEQHPLPQRLLCQLSEGRVGWCCHLAMG